MDVFVVAAESSPSGRFSIAVQALGGKALNSVAWIVPWQDTADSLCLALKPYSESRVVVCSTSDDWSYR